MLHEIGVHAKTLGQEFGSGFQEILQQFAALERAVTNRLARPTGGPGSRNPC